MCPLSWIFLVNAPEHVGQEYGFSPVCTHIWISKANFDAQIKWHVVEFLCEVTANQYYGNIDTIKFKVFNDVKTYVLPRDLFLQMPSSMLDIYMVSLQYVCVDEFPVQTLTHKSGDTLYTG